MLAVLRVPHRYEGGQENGSGTENLDGVGQQQQHHKPSAREAGETGGGRDARGRGQGLTLGPPPPLPTTGAGATGKASPDQGRTYFSPSSPSSGVPGMPFQKTTNSIVVWIDGCRGGGGLVRPVLLSRCTGCCCWHFCLCD